MTSFDKKNAVLALDGDGVIFDYRQAFPLVWKKAFGTKLQLVRPDAYHATSAYGIHWKNAEEEAFFFKHFDEDAWSTMPLMPGADFACHLLARCHPLVIVSSMDPRFVQARVKNCALHGLPIHAVQAVKRDGSVNPKLAALQALAPVALVDDLIDNFAGLDRSIHRALIDYGRFDCPNAGNLIVYDSRHASLLAFAHYWLARS